MDMFDEIAFYLTSKLRDLTDYEHYLQNINNQLLNKTLDENIKITNTCIIDLCPDFKQLALQLSHIELDRLSHICSEEFLNKKYARDKLDDDNIHNNYKKNKNSINKLKQEVYANIQDQIYIDKSMKRKYLKTTSNLDAYELWTNRLYLFVSNEILKLIHDNKKRIQTIEYFIDCADECFRIGNYNSCNLITSKYIYLFDN